MSGTPKLDYLENDVTMNADDAKYVCDPDSLTSGQDANIGMSDPAESEGKLFIWYI